MKNQNVAELYVDEGIKSVEPQAQDGKDDLKDDIKEVKQSIREFKSDLERSLSEFKSDLKDDISDLKRFIIILITIAGFIISGVITVLVKL